MIMSFDPTFARTVMLPFVRAAYAVTANPTHEPQLPAGFTKTALLEADVDLVAELLKDLGDKAAPLRAMTAAGTVYGLIGRNTATQTAFAAFRGTLSLEEWLADFDATAQPYQPLSNFGHVHVGFQAVYLTIRDSLQTGLPEACAGCNRLLVTGHSLGGALAVLAAPDVLLNMPPNLEPQLIAFGGPRVGLSDFVAMFNVRIESCFRVVNFLDIVPAVPLPSPLLPYAHVGTLIPVDSGGPIDPATRHSLDAYDQGLNNDASQWLTPAAIASMAPPSLP
jgi:triacylglycerol lipase